MSGAHWEAGVVDRVAMREHYSSPEGLVLPQLQIINILGNLRELFLKSSQIHLIALYTTVNAVAISFAIFKVYLLYLYSVSSHILFTVHHIQLAVNELFTRIIKQMII